MCDDGKPYRKRGKENLPLIPPLKESPKKKSPQSACARVREEEPELAARFDEFWAAYPSDCPRKSNKAKCLKKYISLLKAAKDPSALHSAILAGLDRWKHCLDWAEEGGRFIKAPLVWLNNENWDDSPRAAKPPKPSATAERKAVRDDIPHGPEAHPQERS